MARTRNQSAIEAIENMTGRDFGMAAVDTDEGLTPEAQERIDQTNREAYRKLMGADTGKTEFRPALGEALPWPATPEAPEKGNPIWIGGKRWEAVGHIEALLSLIAGFNANHDPIQGWCRFCDGNYLHTSEACSCVCHPARAFVERIRENL